MTTKPKKQTKTASLKKKVTLKKETLRDLSAGDKAERVRGGANRALEAGSINGCFGTLA